MMGNAPIAFFAPSTPIIGHVGAGIPVVFGALQAVCAVVEIMVVVPTLLRPCAKQVVVLVLDGGGERRGLIALRAHVRLVKIAAAIVMQVVSECEIVEGVGGGPTCKFVGAGVGVGGGRDNVLILVAVHGGFWQVRGVGCDARAETGRVGLSAEIACRVKGVTGRAAVGVSVDVSVGVGDGDSVAVGAALRRGVLVGLGVRVGLGVFVGLRANSSADEGMRCWVAHRT